MLAALSDDLKPMWTGAIYCGLMDACNELARPAPGRASGPRRPGGGADPLPLASLYPGICRVHRAAGPPASAASGRRPSGRRWAPARTWSASTCSRSPTPSTRWVRCAGAVATWTAPRRRTRRRRRSAATRSRASRCCGWPRGASTGVRVDRRGAGRPAAASWTGPAAAAQVEIALAAGDLDLAEAAARGAARRPTTFDSPGLRAGGAAVPWRRPARPGQTRGGARVAADGVQRLAGARRARSRPLAPGCCSPRPTPARRRRRRRPRAGRGPGLLRPARRRRAARAAGRRPAA